MRHVPEEELHAYLDQALSRSQCIEIETHLATCAPCRRQRDQVAALRDRTTAILATGALKRRPQPAPIEALREQAGRRRQAGWRRTGLWAASIAGALLAGWGMRAVLDPHEAEGLGSQTVVAALPAASPAPDPAIPPRVDPAPEAEPATTPVPVPTWRDPSLRLVGGGQPARGPSAEGGAADGVMDDLSGDWSTISLPQAAEATGNLVPSLPDLPVEAIRMRPAGESERPVLEVTQRRPGGDLLLTVEGPVSDVATLVSAHLRRGWNSSAPSRSLPDYLDEGGTVRRTSRVVAVVGKLPVDSLNALAQAVVVK